MAGFDLWQFLMGNGGGKALNATTGALGNQAITDGSVKAQAAMAASDPYGEFAGGAGTPGLAPDFSDELVRKASSAARLRAQSGYGRASTFLTGALGAPTSGLTTQKPTLLGGG
jgi:hypothetical protein